MDEIQKMWLIDGIEDKKTKETIRNLTATGVVTLR
jgi:hypothetical protein